MKLRYATAEDVRRFMGGPVPWPVRAIAVENESGEIAGMAAVAVTPNGLQAWSTIRDDALRKHRVLMARVAVMLRLIMDDFGAPVVAVCNPQEPTSPGLLSQLGFRPVGLGVWRRCSGQIRTNPDECLTNAANGVRRG